MQILRDAPLGQIIRWVTKNKYLQYPEERPDFQVPAHYLEQEHKASLSETTTQADSSSDEKEINPPVDSDSAFYTPRSRPEVPLNDRQLTQTYSRPNLSRAVTQNDVEQAYEEAIRQETLGTQPSRPLTPQITQDGRILVDWYTTDDPENPQNWPLSKKVTVTFVIYMYTLAVYIGSAIYTPGMPQVMQIFGIKQIVASLGLSIYVAGYGLGPLLFGPLSEIPVIGRNPPYMVTFGIFLILSIIVSVLDNFPAFVVFRFFQGFFGSPVLATGGATLSDMHNVIQLPYYMMLWIAFATVGPAIGPIVSGFSVPVKGWHWAQWEILWLAAPVFVAMMFLLPETSAENLLLRRAARLRKLTGNARLVSQSEIDQSKMTVGEVAVENLWRPVQINLLDPAIAFTSIYIGILYAIFYSFFEAFPMVYGYGNGGGHPTEGYGMNLGQQGLIFLSITVGVLLSMAIFFAYLYYYFNPKIRKHGFGEPEERLIPGMFASIIAPMGLFMFAWTAGSAPQIHWIVPTIGIVIFMIPSFVIFQVVLTYIPLSYPQYAASLFAGNDAVRSSLAAAAIHFSQPLLHNLGVSRAVSLLGGLTVIGVIGIFVLFYYGAWLRSKSRFAAK